MLHITCSFEHLSQIQDKLFVIAALHFKQKRLANGKIANLEQELQSTKLPQ
jgi:hypothetical protein